ncbi:poly(3-hydroxybutyrate) depolymerase [Aquabacterium sp.]|uniref:extracellular catalytic domain type 2 short-chain-length polyhydroxyalkanoate depolymerase n=1 Tax=Aquabacterium sp. TaxID=1872578 RepID=UPI002489356B|nr:poly(3-hydroxybutyrate) depolymerase [Aquabacterium sp.]MDI1258200.1 poly(3-hydroxybutyrate) depolymerase [Aquabacterium sp.]
MIAPFVSMWATLLIALSLTASAQAQVLSRLSALGLQRDAVTVSGLSSGAYMAGQFQVAYSASLSGAAVLAGGPYGCSRGSVSAAMFNCSCPADQNFLLSAMTAMGGGCQVFNPDVYLVFSERAVKGNASAHAIDDTFHVKGHRIWLFSGGQDHVVDAQLVKAAEKFYQRLGVPSAQVHLEANSEAGHGFPSPLATQACSLTHTPFLTQCHVDAAGELLKWLYPNPPLMQAGAADEGSLKQFKQTPYDDRNVFSSLDSTGWAYVPKACEQPGAQCRLHVAFHGCEQGQSFVQDGQKFGLQFVKKAGYNRWAEAGRIVVLYPQVKPSTQGNFFNPYQFNPKGCWDFWGYTEKFAALNPGAPNFAKQSAPQMKAVKAMVDDLLRGL